VREAKMDGASQADITPEAEQRADHPAATPAGPADGMDSVGVATTSGASDGEEAEAPDFTWQDVIARLSNLVDTDSRVFWGGVSIAIATVLFVLAGMPPTVALLSLFSALGVAGISWTYRIYRRPTLLGELLGIFATPSPAPGGPADPAQPQGSVDQVSAGGHDPSQLSSVTVSTGNNPAGHEDGSLDVGRLVSSADRTSPRLRTNTPAVSGGLLKARLPLIAAGAATKFCVTCGVRLDARAEICPSCGVRQMPEPTSAPPAPARIRHGTRWFEIVWTAIYLLLIAYGFAQIDGYYYTLGNLVRDAVLSGFIWAAGLVVATLVRR
jgi:hypothetical protein